MDKQRIRFLQPARNGRISGGYIYNQRVVEELQSLGMDCAIVSLGIDFPNPSPESLRECEQLLGRMEAGHTLVVDSLVLGRIAGLIEQYRHTFRFIALVHLPLHKNDSIAGDRKESLYQEEMRALSRMDLIVVPSAFTRDLLENMGVPHRNIRIIPPGTDGMERSREYPQYPVELLNVSNVLPRKRQHDILRALAALKAFNWRMTFCGDTDLDPGYFSLLTELMHEHQLQSRITFTGRVPAEAIPSHYAGADLFISASAFETFGMVLAEAVANKLPVVSSQAGAISGLVPEDIALFFKTGQVGELTGILKRLFSESSAYRNLARSYHLRQHPLPGWADTAETFYQILNPMS